VGAIEGPGPDDDLAVFLSSSLSASSCARHGHLWSAGMTSTLSLVYPSLLDVWKSRERGVFLTSNKHLSAEVVTLVELRIHIRAELPFHHYECRPRVRELMAAMRHGELSPSLCNEYVSSIC